MFKCVKTHDYRVRDLLGSTNRGRQRVAEADTTSIDPSAVGVQRENSDDIWSLYLFTHTWFMFCHTCVEICLAS